MVLFESSFLFFMISWSWLTCSILCLIWSSLLKTLTFLECPLTVPLVESIVLFDSSVSFLLSRCFACPVPSRLWGWVRRVSSMWPGLWRRSSESGLHVFCWGQHASSVGDLLSNAVSWPGTWTSSSYPEQTNISDSSLPTPLPSVGQGQSSAFVLPPYRENGVFSSPSPSWLDVRSLTAAPPAR